MGYHHILTISEDAMLHEGSQRNDIDVLLGAAVIDACFGSETRRKTAEGPLLRGEKNAQILSGDTVHHVDEHEAGDFAVYIWVRGELRVPSALDERETDLAIVVLQAEKMR